VVAHSAPRRDVVTSGRVGCQYDDPGAGRRIPGGLREPYYRQRAAQPARVDLDRVRKV